MNVMFIAKVLGTTDYLEILNLDSTTAVLVPETGEYYAPSNPRNPDMYKVVARRFDYQGPVVNGYVTRMDITLYLQISPSP